VDCNDNATSTISLLRKSESPKDTILIVCNFTPVPRLGYRIGVPEGGAGANCSTAMPANTVEAALAMSAERRPLPNQFMDVLIRYGLTLPPLGALSLKRE
jgi:1,4-alpha-glucan branching enzyme